MAKNIKNSWLRYLDNIATEHCDARRDVDDINSLADKLFFPTIFQHFFYHSIPAVYVLDYRTGAYCFFTENVNRILGHSYSDLMRYGLELTLDSYHPQDLSLFNNQIFSDRLEILRSLPPSQHKDYVFTYTFRFKDGKGGYNNVMQRNCFIQSDNQGNPLISMGMVINVTHQVNPGIVRQTVEKLSITPDLPAELLLQKQYFLDEKERVFSHREMEILNYTADGLSYKEIAARLFIAEGTVIQHRKNMLRKANAKNVAELVAIAVRKGYL